MLGSKAKIRKFDGTIGDQDVLWFEVPVIYANGMTELDSVQYLKERIFGHEIITKVMALFRDAGEQITFRTEFKDYIGTVVGIHYLDERDHIRVMAGRMMQLDLPLLETPLP